MTAPLVIAIPHTLGKEEARRRLKSQSGDISRLLPGLAAANAHWSSPDRLALGVSAFGQSVSAFVDVEEYAVRVTVHLPAMLGFFTEAIESGVREAGTKLLR